MSEPIAVLFPIIIGAFALVVGAGVCGCCFCCCLLPLWRLFFPAQYSLLNNNSNNNEKTLSLSLSHQHSYASTDDSHHSSHHQHLHQQQPQYFDISTSSSSSTTESYFAAFATPPLAAAAAVTETETGSYASTSGSGFGSIQVEQSASQRGFKDVWAAVLFAVNVGSIFYLAAKAYADYKDEIAQNISTDTVSNNFDANTFTAIVSFVLFMVVMSSIICSLGVYVLLHNAARIIDWVNWMNIIIFGTLTIVSLVTLQFIGAFMFAVFTIMNYWYYYSIQDRIPFASAVIETACHAVRANFSGVLITAYMGLLFQVLWVLLWGVAFYGVIHSKADSSDDDLSGWVYFMMILSVYWGVQVFHYVVSVTAGGTVATWWFQPNNASPVLGSLFRAVTTSFGSICFGSLIVAFIQTCREVLRGVKRQSERQRERNVALECAICLADNLLSCVERLMIYVNRFAYSYVAAYGYDFIGAGRQVTQLFQRRGWTAIINDNLISNAFGLFSVGLAIVSAAIGAFAIVIVYSVGGLAFDGGIILIGVILGFAIGFIVAQMMINSLDSAVAMVFVCFAEDVGTLSVNHPESYEKLSRTWEHFNPGTLVSTSVNLAESGYSAPLAQARVIEGYGESNYSYSINSRPHGNPPPVNPNYKH